MKTSRYLAVAAFAGTALLGLEPGMPSRTSIQVMVARALGSHDPDPAVRNPDWLAEQFVGVAEREVLAGTVFAKALDMDWRDAVKDPELSRMVRVHLIRTRFMDEKMLKALDEGATQVVILGAGFDSRAYRFQGRSKNARFFEVDYGPTQEHKKRRVKEVLGAAPANLTYVPIDFTKDRLGDVLKRAGFKSDQKTFFLWEGVSYYLPPATVGENLEFFAKNSKPGSGIAGDFILQSFIDRIEAGPRPDDSPSVRGILAMARRLKETGEPWLSGVPDADAAGYFRKYGLELVEFAPHGSAETTKRYRTRRDGTLVGTEPAEYFAPAFNAELRVASR